MTDASTKLKQTASSVKTMDWICLILSGNMVKGAASRVVST